MTIQRTLKFNVEIDSKSAEVGLESVSIKAEKVADSVKKVNTAWENFGKKMKTFFNDKILARVIREVKTAFVDWTKGLLKTNDETRSAISKSDKYCHILLYEANKYSRKSESINIVD